jgi:hypothetical protein
MSEFRGLSLQEQDDQIRQFGPTGEALKALWERMKSGPITDFATLPPSATSRGFDFVFEDWPKYMLGKVGGQAPVEQAEPPPFNPWIPGSAQPDLPWDRDQAGIPFGGGMDISALLGPRRTTLSSTPERPIPRMQMPDIPDGVPREIYEEYLREMEDLRPTDPEAREFGLQDILGAAAAGTVGATSAGEALAGAGSNAWAVQRAFEDQEALRREAHNEQIREHRAALAQAGLAVEEGLMEQEMEKFRMAQEQARFRLEGDLLAWEQSKPQFQLDGRGNVILSSFQNGQRVIERLEVPTLLDQIDLAARSAEAQGGSIDDVLDRVLEVGDREININGNTAPEVVAVMTGAAMAATGQIPLPPEAQQMIDNAALVRMFPGMELDEAITMFSNLGQDQIESAQSRLEETRFQVLLEIMQGNGVSAEDAAMWRSNFSAYLDPRLRHLMR